MPRTAREVSPSGIYHVTLRGVNKAPIFLSSREKDYFLNTLAKKSTEQEYILNAYCIMDNHAHLLMKVGNMALGESMKRICVTYANYYNKKHTRWGHVFQNRFHSVTIDGEKQFMVCARYIHNNPVKAGLTKDAHEYHWSSFRVYLGLRVAEAPLDTSSLLKLYDPDKDKAIPKLQAFTHVLEDDYTETGCLQALIKNVMKQNHGEIKDIILMAKPRRDEILREILKQTDAKIPEIADILNISPNILYKIRRGIKNRA